jgi:predicted secreted hydrolase
MAAVAVALIAGAPRAAQADDPYAPVTAGQRLEFPADFGSHPLYRTEWWYITGWLRTAGGESLGFQVTFFRSRPSLRTENPSAFTPRQLIIVHCALSDPQRGRLWQDQRVRRASLGLAGAEVGDTAVWADGWRLRREPSAGEPYVAHVAAEEFSLDLAFTPTQAPMLNGLQGFSRKGPAAASASFYYSIPHLRVTGGIVRGTGQGAKTDVVTGEAWLDHEWSSDYLDPEAVGWDWIGINLDDGGALMAFRIRGANGEPRWAGGTLRRADGRIDTLDAGDVTFSARRTWLSPRTGTRYPVEWTVRAGSRQFALEPLLDDQENDTRLSTGALYWEGAVRAFEHGAPAGRGYLELTGYAEKLQLR